MPTPIWKEKAKAEAEELKQWALNGEVDAKADSFLDKLKASKWTGVILCGGMIALFLFWLLG